MKRDFAGLKRALILRLLLYAALAGIIVFLIKELLIDGVVEAPFANWFVNLVERRFGVSNQRAISLYQVIFRNNKELYIGILFGICALILIMRLLSEVTKYFVDVSKAMDTLLTPGSEIKLPRELSSLGDKMTRVKEQLEARDRAAKEAEQRKNDLVVYLAHDIKTPLTSVIGYLNLLSEAPDMPPEQRAKYTDITLDKAYRLETLIDEFFDITRFNLHTIVLQKSRVNVHVMLEQMADEFFPVLTPQGKRIELAGDGDVFVEADADKLARVFNNVLKNAIAYSENDTAIRVSISDVPQGMQVRFENKGLTIPKDKLDTIFDKFFRLDSARSTATGGAGLGLAIAREIVTAHGGSIAADSEDGITAFTVTLPR